MTKLENFVNAFSDIGGGDMYCNCGKHYYESEYLQTLGKVIRVQVEIDNNCVEVDYVGRIEFMGKGYVDACDCWQDQAKKIIGFVDSHRHQIASYLNFEKESLLTEANIYPTINT